MVLSRTVEVRFGRSFCEKGRLKLTTGLQSLVPEQGNRLAEPYLNGTLFFNNAY